MQEACVDSVAGSYFWRADVILPDDVRVSVVRILCGVSEPSDAPGLVARAERFFGLGEPKLRSRSQRVFLAALTVPVGVLSVGLIFWYAFSGQGRSSEVLLQCGILFLMLMNLFDGVGASLYVRRGAQTGRVLRVLGYAVFFPLSMVCYLAYSWFSATWLFVAEASSLAVLLVYGMVRVRRRPRDRSRSDPFDGG